MMEKIKRGLILLALLVMGCPLFSQSIAVKSNLLYDLSTTLNLGVEVKLSPKWSIDISGNYNPFSFSNDKKANR